LNLFCEAQCNICIAKLEYSVNRAFVSYNKYRGRFV